jgi:hypothetical protein
MFTLWIGDPDAKDDPEPQDVITLGAEPDVLRMFTTITRMAVKKYGKAGMPYPDLLMVPTYHMTDVVFTPDEFRQIQEQARAFLAQERPTDELVIDVLNTLAGRAVADLVGRKDANARGEGDVRWTLKPPWFAPRGRGDDPKRFKHTYFMYCPNWRPDEGWGLEEPGAASQGCATRKPEEVSGPLLRSYTVQN